MKRIFTYILFFSCIAVATHAKAEQENIYAQYGESRDESVIAAALQDESAQVRYAALSTLQTSENDWSKLLPIIRELSTDDSQPSEIGNISRQLLQQQ